MARAHLRGRGWGGSHGAGYWGRFLWGRKGVVCRAHIYNNAAGSRRGDRASPPEPDRRCSKRQHCSARQGLSWYLGCPGSRGSRWWLIGCGGGRGSVEADVLGLRAVGHAPARNTSSCRNPPHHTVSGTAPGAPTARRGGGAARLSRGTLAMCDGWLIGWSKLTGDRTGWLMSGAHRSGKSDIHISQRPPGPTN